MILVSRVCCFQRCLNCSLAVRDFVMGLVSLADVARGGGVYGVVGYYCCRRCCGVLVVVCTSIVLVRGVVVVVVVGWYGAAVVGRGCSDE